MALPTSLNIALKEWAVLCAAMESGRQILLLRKGGIYESGGEFEIEHRQFLFFPTYLHQNPQMLKEEFRGDVKSAGAEPEQIHLSVAGVITDIIPMPTRQVIDALDSEHIWTPPLIDMRFNYRPENPLYLLLVRTYRLQKPVVIANMPAYAGCKSWVPLESPVGTGNAQAVLDDDQYESRRRGIIEKMG